MPVTERYKTDPEKYRAERKASYKRNRTRNRAKDVAASHDWYHSVGKHRLREKKYGVTQEQYEQRLASQGAACAICRATEPGGRGTWHVDHDHTTKHVRGLLCARCNIGIGCFREEVALLEAAVKYMNADSPAENQWGTQSP